MTKSSRALLCTALLSLTQLAQSVPHFDRDAYPGAKPCHVKKISPALVRRFGTIRNAVIQNATVPQDIAVIIVRFPSANLTHTSGSPNFVDLDNVNTYFTTMQDFFAENSFGTMPLTIKFFGSGAAANGELDANVAGSFLMPQPMEYYGCGDVDAGCSGIATPVAPVGLGGAYLIRDAIAATRLGPPNRAATFNSTNYDAVLIMHAGYGNETTQKNGNIWSAYYPEEDTIDDAGGNFVDGAVFPELETGAVTSPAGVICHEFGHILTLPDLYNTGVYGGATVVGNWDLMDNGPYLNAGTNPGHLGAWTKTYLGWTTPQVISGRSNVSLAPIESGPSNAIIKIPILNASPKEYFMVEYRSSTAGAYDHGIAGTGLLIWHIDDQITEDRGFDGSPSNRVNTGSPHYGVSVVTANGSTISNINKGGQTHLFTTDVDFGIPQSNSFASEPTAISILQIQAGVGISPATFFVENLRVSATQAIKKAINYPNPAGKGYNHPRGEGYTTLQVVLGKTTERIEINIYTLSGDLVRKINLSSSENYKVDRSQDERFVYEYDWDLKNGSGDHVAPGVYIYLIRADGETKSAKAVVIR